MPRLLAVDTFPMAAYEIPDDPAATAAAPFNFSYHRDDRLMPAPAPGIDLRRHDEIILSPAHPALPMPPPPEAGATQIITHIEDEPA